MAYTYRGTKITGTSTSAKVFKKSGIKNAKKNQTYFNTATGHVYTCDTAGKASKAKWKYTRTDIAGRPFLQLGGLSAPSRTTSGSNTRLMQTGWSVPAALTNAQNGNRAESFTLNWWLGIPGADPQRVVGSIGTGTTSSSVDLTYFPVGRTVYYRHSFYPFSGKPKLEYVTVGIKAHNSKGDGPETKATTRFTTPRSPSIDEIAFNAETGIISTTVRTDPGNDNAERWDTRYVVNIYESATGRSWNSSDSSSTSTEIPLTYNASGYQGLAYNEFIRVTVTAWSRGYAGDSGKVSRSFYISYPAQSTIDSIDVSSKSPSGKCTVRLNTNRTTEHPVDRIKLEYLADVSYEDKEDIPSGDSWTDSDIIDDGDCTALTVPVADIAPGKGKYTWVRVKAWHANEAVLYRYSDYARVTGLETPAPTAADDDIAILSVAAGADGESAVIQLGWNKDGQDDSTGTELSWSDQEDTWKSTDEPKSHEITWSDGPITVDNVTYRDSANIVIKGLDEGVKYYVKARRYLDGDTKTYSPYSNTATIIPSERPESIVATADRYVPKDGSLTVRWTFSGNGLQKSWQVVKRVAKGGTMADDTIIAAGYGSLGSTRISAERLSAFATNGDLIFNVQASTGSGFVSSEDQIVTIIESPTLEITGSSLVHVHEDDEQTYTGNIIEIDNPRNLLGIKSLTADIAPIQSGSGTPSPTNIRPISGHTECVTYVSPTTSETDATTYTTSLGRTVYGGSLDVVSGVLTVDRAMVDLGSLTWNYISGSNFNLRSTNDIGALPPATLSTMPRAISSIYPALSYAEVSDTDKSLAIVFATSGQAGKVWVRDSSYTDAQTFKSAVTGQTLVYELATPQTYQLTPQQVELLTGVNNLWNGCGTTEVTTVETLVDGDFLQTNNLSINFKSNQLCDLITIVTAQGASGQFPQGVLRQTAGDTIHSDVYEPEWTEANSEFTATINLPTALDFWDGGNYKASIVAVDRRTGLKSDEVTLDISIAWIHQAVAPSGFVTLTALNYMDDENDMHHQAVQIDMTPPTGSAVTDVYDIYRMTGDGAKLIGQTFPLTGTAIDEYAPFGDDITCYYRIALRTADGDVEFSDLEYNLEGNAMRFDWSGGTLELPYNLSIADSYKKNVDIRNHMDGSVDGYWNQNIERKGSLKSDAIRLEQQEDINAARKLARYPGAVFVRTPDGSAYEADVQVSDLSTEGVMTAIAIDAQEIGLTREFILPAPYPLEEE